MKELDQIDRIMKKYEEHTDFSGPVSDSRIQQEEAALELKFPVDYRHFLKQYGAGVFEGCEIYGIVPEKDTKAIPNGMWATAYLREKMQMPQEYIAIGFDGFGGYYCIDTSCPGKDGLCPVVLFVSSPKDAVPVDEVSVDDIASHVDISENMDADVEKRPIVEAENFAVFLLEQLKEEIDRII